MDDMPPYEPVTGESPTTEMTSDEGGSDQGADTARAVGRSGPLREDQQHEGVVQPHAGSCGPTHGSVPARRQRQDQADVLDGRGPLPPSVANRHSTSSAPCPEVENGQPCLWSDGHLHRHLFREPADSESAPSAPERDQ